MFGHNDQQQKEDEVIQSQQLDDAARDLDEQAAAGQSVNDNQAGANDGSSFVATPVAPITPTSTASAPEPAATDDLLDIKHQALQELTPLVGQLEQTPEEQFRTTMMMIQASDNHALVKVAYEAAKKISNEKERAQALLDIVNEINYFTQHTAQA